MLAVGPGVLLFGEESNASTTLHRQPAHKLVVAPRGTLHWQWRTPAESFGRVGSGVLIPPELTHHIITAGPCRALLVEPWVTGVPSCSAPVTLSDALSRDLLLEIDRYFGEERAADDLLPLVQMLLAPLRARSSLASRRPVREEVRVVAERLAAAQELGALGSAVGLSPTRLREVFRAEIGTTLGRLRSWQRLSLVAADARFSLADRSLRAGFSDQAHMTRNARALIGRTPSAILASRLNVRAGTAES